MAFFKKSSPSFPKKKSLTSAEANLKELDFKDIQLLSRFVTERGRILPRKITGLSAQSQRKVARAVKRARQMSLLPFLRYGYN